jgi:hypothetical protein
MQSARAPGARRSAWLIALAAATISAAGMSVDVASPRPVLAADAGNGLDIELETDTVNAGTPVVITVRVSQTGSGGQGDGDVVRFYFIPGSPNDTAASPDLTCVLAGTTCSVTYVPVLNGTDLVCATTETSILPCFIAWDAAPGVSRADVVRRIVVNGTGPAPVATAPPTPAPAPAQPTPAPSQATPAATSAAPTPSPSTAAPGSPPRSTTRISPVVDAATADVPPGEVVTLNVSLLYPDGSRAFGDAADVVVGFYFLPGSPNEQTSRQNKPDLSCRTGADASCAVTYVARNLGVDTICAHTGPQGQWQTSCAEPWNGRDLDNATDVVRRRVAAPSPSASPPASEAPTAPGAPVPDDDVVVPPAPSNRGTTVSPPPATATPPPAPEATAPAEADVGRVFWQVWSAIVEGLERAVRPEAAARVATTFGFPLALMLAVLLFLVVQHQIDRRDPKLRHAPRALNDTMQRFRDEDELHLG